MRQPAPAVVRGARGDRIVRAYQQLRELIVWGRLAPGSRVIESDIAERLSIRDRGMLHEGMYADIVLFDPATIIDRATYEQPNQLSVGVRDVFVNGVEVVREGGRTGAMPGHVVRGPGIQR